MGRLIPLHIYILIDLFSTYIQNAYTGKISPGGELPIWADTFWGHLNRWAETDYNDENSQFVHHLQRLYREYHGHIIRKTKPENKEALDYLDEMDLVYNRFIAGIGGTDANVDSDGRHTLEHYHNLRWLTGVGSDIYVDPKVAFREAEGDMDRLFRNSIIPRFTKSERYMQWVRRPDGGQLYVKWAEEHDFVNPNPPPLPAGWNEATCDEKRAPAHEYSSDLHKYNFF